MGNDKFEKKTYTMLKTYFKLSLFSILLQTSRNLIGKGKGSLALNTPPF